MESILQIDGYSCSTIVYLDALVSDKKSLKY